MQRILRAWKQLVILVAIVVLTTGCKAFLPSLSFNPWQVIQVPVEANLLDISFTDDPQHGWVVGTSSALMETTDGGKTWNQKVLDLGEQVYRFSSISFKGEEGWVAGQPSLLLHTTDGGKSWARVPLSEKLPGSPENMFAIAPDTAEMVTDIGAMYRTTDGGRNWKALVTDAFGVVRSLHRSDDGRYIAVSARGNFFSTWEPGQAEWQPYNRNSSRRLQNMGFTKDGRFWMLARGGQMQFTNSTDPEDWQEAINPEFATSWGLLDMAFRTNDEAWVVGGSGTLLGSFDGGKTWQKDREVEDVPANLYKVVFFDQNTGYAIGQRGTLLKYQKPAQAA
jgi:photosystem II stability/assembly factor-like uncharacterized protein